MKTFKDDKAILKDMKQNKVSFIDYSVHFSVVVLIDIILFQI